MSSEQDRLRKGSFSFYEEDLRQLESLAAQRKRKKDTELQREALHAGTLFESIREEPDPLTGNYGNLTVEQLAKMIRPLVVLGMDWLNQHGFPLDTPGASLAALFNALSAQRTGDPRHGIDFSDAAMGTANRSPLHEGTYISGSALERLDLDDDPIL